MQERYTYQELKKKYLTAAETWKDMPETDAEYKKACAKLEKLVPDAELREEIKDCFELCLDKYQIQGFIRGFMYSLNTLSEESKKELPPDKKKMSPHQRISKCEELTYGIAETKDLCSKLHLIYNDMFEEIETEHPRIEELRIRLDMMSDYIARLMDNSDKVYELAEVVYQSVGGTYVE